MRLLVAVLLFLGTVWSQQEAEVVKNLIKLKEKGLLSDEVLKQVEKYREELNEVVEETKKEVVGGRSSSPQKFEGKTVYVFMSSSVPVSVWQTYARTARSLGMRVVFLLRGCVGGCTYIKPTLSFISKVLDAGGENLPAEVWIDPLKFREYGVSRVPCVFLEKGPGLSCGDWSLTYHLKRLGGF